MSSRFTAPYRRLLLPVVVALAITACQKKTEPAADAPAAAAGPTAETLEGQVDIVAWPGYIERGDTDKNYDWVTEFEKKTSCKVNVKTAATSDEMVALMNEGGFDLVTASGDASLRLIAGNAPGGGCQASRAANREELCQAGVDCGLMDDRDLCQAGAGVSGSEAIERLRRALDRLEDA